MTDTTNAGAAELLEALAVRVEQYGEDREADEAIADALFQPEPFAQLKDAPVGVGCRMWRQDGHIQSALRYTSSLDAALTLIGSNAFWRLGHDPGDPALFAAQCSYEPGEGRLGFVTAYSTMPALALTAAALRARAAIARTDPAS